MRTLEQSNASWVQFWLGALHLYAMSIAGVAFVVHGAAVAHHWQRAGLLPGEPVQKVHRLPDETAESADAFVRAHHR